MASIAIPGQVIGSLETHIPGSGTHVYESKIHASLAGTISTTPPPSKTSNPTISVLNLHSPEVYETTVSSSPQLPAVGNAVIARVLRVQQRQVGLAILLVNPSASTSITQIPALVNDDVLPQAILRREDVRAHEKDKIVLNDCFRAGDIVRASVISLGDERNYYVSTAGNEFGVVSAKSAEGNVMIPVSWKGMKDIVTGKEEGRKCAKP